MAFGRMKLVEMNAQEQSTKVLQRQAAGVSWSDDVSPSSRGSQDVRRAPSIPPFFFKVEKKRLIKLTGLHHTNLVDVYLAIHTLSHQLLVVKVCVF